MSSELLKAKDLWKLFYREDRADSVEEIPNVVVPAKWAYAGQCVTTYYTSNKWQKDRSFYERYYHDHAKGKNHAKIWVPEGAFGWTTGEKPPARVRTAASRGEWPVAKLARALFCDIVQPGGVKGKIEFDRGACLLGATNRKDLYVLEGKKIVAFITGPKVQIQARGIVG